ncbi:unnamed protein product, partial [Nesidiocoris tenuis]
MDEESFDLDDFTLDSSLLLRERFVILNELLLLKGARVEVLRRIALSSNAQDDGGQRETTNRP